MKKYLPWVTIGLALLWIGLYYGFLHDLDPEDKRRILLLLGAKARSPILDGGEVWRLLTSTFLHHSAFHLWANVTGVAVLGLYLEKQVSRISWISLTLITVVIAMGDDLWWHEGVTVGGSVVVFCWAGAAFGNAFKEKKLASNIPFLLALSIYLAATFWIGAQVVHIAQRTHWIALAIGFVLGLHLPSIETARNRRWLEMGAVLTLMILWWSQDFLVQYATKTEPIKIAETGLALDSPIFWDVTLEEGKVKISNATDVVLWASCQVEQKPPNPEQVIGQFLRDQLYWPQVVGAVSDFQFRPARTFVTSQGRALSGYQVPFSFVGTQGRYDGLYYLWITGLTHCVVVTSSWQHVGLTAQSLLQEMNSSLRFEPVLDTLIKEETLGTKTYEELLLGAQKAFELGESSVFQRFVEKLEGDPEPDKGHYYLLRAKQALVIQENEKEAMSWSLKALDTLPDDREVVLLVASLLLQQGKVRQVRQILMHAHILSSNFGDWLEKTRWLIP